MREAAALHCEMCELVGEAKEWDEARHCSGTLTPSGRLQEIERVAAFQVRGGVVCGFLFPFFLLHV